MLPLLAFFVWLYELLRRRVELLFIAILSSGPIPKHVGFIMDGNRRYARGKNMEVFRGHSDGFQALKQLLEACLDLKIRCVSVYAFAIENFKRSPEEVDALMHLAEEKVTDLCSRGNLLEKHGVRLRIIGRRDLLPEYVRIAFEKAEEITKHHDQAILNLCMPYASSEEMTTAIKRTVCSALKTKRPTSSISPEDIAQNLYTASTHDSPSPPLDILVRTSGVRRLSDFFLWQCSEDTQIQFVSCYWPDFGFRAFVPIIFAFQQKVWAREREKFQREEERLSSVTGNGYTILKDD